MIDLELIDDEERRPKSLVYTTTLLYDPGEMPRAYGGVLWKVRPISTAISREMGIKPPDVEVIGTARLGGRCHALSAQPARTYGERQAAAVGPESREPQFKRYAGGPRQAGQGIPFLGAGLVFGGSGVEFGIAAGRIRHNCRRRH